MPYELGPSGFVTRKGDAPKQEDTPAMRFYRLYSGSTLSQNILPVGLGVEQPRGIMYYGPAHIQEMRHNLEAMRQLSLEGLGEFLNVDRQISTAVAIQQVRANIEFSEGVHRLLSERPAQAAPEDVAEAKERMRKKLLGIK